MPKLFTRKDDLNHVFHVVGALLARNQIDSLIGISEDGEWQMVARLSDVVILE